MWSTLFLVHWAYASNDFIRPRYIVKRQQDKYTGFFRACHLNMITIAVVVLVETENEIEMVFLWQQSQQRDKA